MKIEEDDLKKIFTSDHDSFSIESKNEKVTIKKIKSFNEIKKVRKTLRRFTSKKQQSDFNELINSILRFLAVAGFSGFIIFVGLGWSGISKQIEWGYYVSYLNRGIPTATATATPIATKTPTPTITSTQRVVTFATPEPSIVARTPAPTPIPAPTTPINFPTNNLRIAKINVGANVHWDVEEGDILNQLKSGVAHYKDTSKPGEGGNIFIVGHSSNYPWIISSYNSVFALLDKLAPGDRIELSDNTKNYVYEVKSTRIIKPDDVNVLDSTSKETLSLLTCWPIGTSLKRMIVQAELLYVQ